MTSSVGVVTGAAKHIVDNTPPRAGGETDRQLSATRGQYNAAVRLV